MPEKPCDIIISSSQGQGGAICCISGAGTIENPEIYEKYMTFSGKN